MIERRGDQTSGRTESGLPTRVFTFARRTEGLTLAVLDVGVVLTAWLIATPAAMRASGEVGSVLVVAGFVLLASAIQIVGHRVAGMYGPVWEYASVEEAVRVVVGVIGGVAAATVTLGVVELVTGAPFPLSTAPALAALLSLLGCGGVRFQARLYAAERGEVARDTHRLRTVIVGAGAVGAALAHELTTTDTGRSVRVVGFVDEDPSMARRSVRGLPVIGSTHDLAQVCLDNAIDRVLITTATTGPELRSTIARALATDAQVKVLPAASERGQGPLVRNLRDLDVTDLLGREPAPLGSEAIGEYLSGVTVLVTGAGGSIGSEVARQVIGFGPARLLVLDRDETLLHDLVTGPLAASGAEPILADICDERSIRSVFAQHRPDVVFHAAAQKHVPILEHFPAEAARVNVLGTLVVARTAAETGCRRFVHISTDKAADPCSVMGASKRAAEQIVFELGNQHDLPFVAVRFGNVLASRGSVVPTFLRQILEGGPITVTDPEMTRYFMTIPEAVGLVLQSGAMATEGRIYLLDMGEPVPILGLANQMIRLAGLRPDDDIKIEITGLRPGERLHERLHDDAEVVHPSAHASISSLEPKTTWDWTELVKRLGDLRGAVEDCDDSQVRSQLEDLLRAGGVDCSLRVGAPD